MKQFLTILSVIIFLFSACCESEVITIDNDRVVTQNFIGNGVQWDPYPHADSPDAEWGLLMTKEKWEKVFDRLNYMQPRFIRVVDQANWRYLQGFDQAGNPIINFNTLEEKALGKVLAYCQDNNITVLLGEWGTPYEVHDTDAGFSGILKGATDERWINMIVQHLEYLINEKGFTCIRYFNLVNEPNGYWASTDGDFYEWSEGAKMLANAIEEKGLSQYISVAGPDVVADYNHPYRELTGMQWVEHTAKKLNNNIGALEIHAYFEQNVIREAKVDSIYRPLVKLANNIDKPIFFGEVGFEKSTPENQSRVEADPHASSDSYMAVYDFQHGIDMADALIQIMNTGFHGAAAWALDDAMHTKDDNGDKNMLKRWGMWNILGTELHNNPADENIRPWFYTWSLLCRYIPAGSQIIEVDQTPGTGVRITAAQKDDQLTVALVNQSKTSRQITLKMPSGSSKFTFQFFNYKKDHYLTDENGFPLPENKNLKIDNDQITLTLPSKSFQLLTSYK